MKRELTGFYPWAERNPCGMMRQAVGSSHVHIEPIVVQSDSDHVEDLQFYILMIALKMIIDLQLQPGRFRRAMAYGSKLNCFQYSESAVCAAIASSRQK